MHNRTTIFARQPASTRSLMGVLLCSLAMLGCDTSVSAPDSLTFDDANLYVRLEMNHRAVLMSTIAPYDTVRLHTIPMGDKDIPYRPSWMTDSQFDSLLQANPPTYISKDSSRVRVSNDGLLQAVSATTATGTVQIIATRQIGNITKACTTFVRALAVNAPKPIHRLVISSVDSLKVAHSSTIPLTVSGIDSNGNTISNVVTYVRSTNKNIAPYNSPGWNLTSMSGGGAAIGQATVTVRTFAYGAPAEASFVVRNGYKITWNIEIGELIRFNALALDDAIIGVGGTVSWMYDSIGSNDPDMDIIFDRPESVMAALNPSQNTGGGNIYGIPGDPTVPPAAKIRYRRFVEPGIYVYRVQPFNKTGRVIVKSD